MEGENFTTGGDLYGDDGNQPNYGGNEGVFGSSPYSIHGGGLVNAWALKDLTSPVWMLRMVNEALIIVCMVFLFAAVWFKNESAQNLMQFATAVLIASAVSNEMLDMATLNYTNADSQGMYNLLGIGAGATTGLGLVLGSFWAAA